MWSYEDDEETPVTKLIMPTFYLYFDEKSAQQERKMLDAGSQMKECCSNMWMFFM